MRMNMKQQQQRRNAFGSVTEGVREKKRRERRFICFSQCEVSQGPTWERGDGWGASICLASVPQSLSPTASEPGLPKAQITYSFLPSLSTAVTRVFCTPPGGARRRANAAKRTARPVSLPQTQTLMLVRQTSYPRPDTLLLTRHSWAIGRETR